MTRRFARFALADGTRPYVELKGDRAWRLKGPPWLGAMRTSEPMAVDEEGRPTAPGSRRLAPLTLPR